MAIPSPLSEISVHVECAYYRFVNVQVYFVLSWQRLSAEVADAGFSVTTAKCISIPVDVPQSRLLLQLAAAALHLIDSNVDVVTGACLLSTTVYVVCRLYVEDDKGSYSRKQIVRTIEQLSYDLRRWYDTTSVLLASLMFNFRSKKCHSMHQDTSF